MTWQAFNVRPSGNVRSGHGIGPARSMIWKKSPTCRILDLHIAEQAGKDLTFSASVHAFAAAFGSAICVDREWRLMSCSS